VTNLLSAQGFASVLTSVPGPGEQSPFLDAGYRVHEILSLLEVNLHRTVAATCPQPGLRIRLARRSDVKPILKLDAAAFDTFWRFDTEALVEAAHATPRNRQRVAQQGKKVVGYTMIGQSGRTGFIQRLAVDPDHYGQGTGRTLLLDGLRWLQNREVFQALVNTQPGNSRALALYQSVGFTQRPEDLAVLRLDRIEGPGGNH